jgi:aspartyl/glutamyl-tRNA(Asn/Gln) amidotransferase C subunit
MNLEELGKLRHGAGNIDTVLKFVEQISRAKVSSDEIATTVIPLCDLRDDVVYPSMPLKDVLGNAKNRDNNFFIVPQVVE